jgi:hypothetical protein
MGFNGLETFEMKSQTATSLREEVHQVPMHFTSVLMSEFPA